MLLHLALGISLACSQGFPNREAISQFVQATSKRAVHVFDSSTVLEVNPHDSLQYHGPRETLDGWTEGPVVG